MAAQAYLIVILDCRTQVFGISYADVVGVGIVAHPAVELLVVLLKVYAGLVFFVDSFEIELCKILIPGMTVETNRKWFKAQLVWMGESVVFRRMAIGAIETSMVGNDILGRIHLVIWIHPFFHISAQIFIEISKVWLSVALEALAASFAQDDQIFGGFYLRKSLESY
jgi:hypothetical protein